MTPEQIAEAVQRLARLEQEKRNEAVLLRDEAHELDMPDDARDACFGLAEQFEAEAAAAALAQQALREWVPREDRLEGFRAAYAAGAAWATDNPEEDAKFATEARRLLKLEDTP